MVRTRATVRRLDDFRVVARVKKPTVYPFKIKVTLPEQKKTVNITKNGQILKAINVRRKFRYFINILRKYIISIKCQCFLILFFP